MPAGRLKDLTVWRKAEGNWQLEELEHRSWRHQSTQTERGNNWINSRPVQTNSKIQFLILNMPSCSIHKVFSGRFFFFFFFSEQAGTVYIFALHNHAESRTQCHVISSCRNDNRSSWWIKPKCSTTTATTTTTTTTTTILSSNCLLFGDWRYFARRALIDSLSLYQVTVFGIYQGSVSDDGEAGSCLIHVIHEHQCGTVG